MRFSRRSRLVSLAAGVGLLAFAVSAAGKSSTDLPSLPSSATTDTGSSTQSNTNAQTIPPSSSSQTTASSTASQSSDQTSSASSIDSSASRSPSNSQSVTGPTNLPTLSGGFVIVAPPVPPTADAPFMQQSNLPEGTVFIIVGAILGFLAVSVILRRGLVVWSLHRSIKRAALQQNVSTAKARFQTPQRRSINSRTVSPLSPWAEKALNQVGKVHGQAPATGLGNQSLFFSPTAGANGLANPGNRASSYLPAGYYAAGASQLGNGQGMAHVGSTNPGISLSNLGTSRDGYARTRSVGPGPPGSPYINAIFFSSSTLNLSRQAPGDQRAPSAYLDDLFDSERSPPMPGHSKNLSGSRSAARH